MTHRTFRSNVGRRAGLACACLLAALAFIGLGAAPPPAVAAAADDQEPAAALLTEGSEAPAAHAQYRPPAVGDAVEGFYAWSEIQARLDRIYLLKGIRAGAVIDSPGVPSQLVLAPTAVPVILGERSAVVAAARFARGRVVALGHTGYLNFEGRRANSPTGRLLLNASRWLTRGKSRARIAVVDRPHMATFLKRNGFKVIENPRLDSPQELSKLDAICLIPSKVDEELYPALERFLRRGGGVLAAEVGWVWKGEHAAFPGNRLLEKTGIHWAQEYAGDTAEDGFVVTTGFPPPYDLSYSMKRLPDVDWTSVEKGERDVLLRAGTTFAHYARFHDVPPGKLAAVAGTWSPLYPGTVRADASRVTRTVELAVEPLDGRGLTAFRPQTAAWYGCGLYAAPGEVVRVTLPPEAADRGLKLRVGIHEANQWGNHKWTRFPGRLSRVTPVSSETSEIWNAHGGLIYLQIPAGWQGGNVAMTVEGAVRAPRYVSGVTDWADWRDEIRRYPAPWAELVGENVAFNVPSSLLAEDEAYDPQPFLNYWDMVAASHGYLSGRSLERRRPDRFVPDKRPLDTRVLAVAGYPIRVPHGWGEELLADFDRHSWGMFHELGHNHQAPAWSFGGVGEVVVNLFTLHAYDVVEGDAPATAFERWIGKKTRKDLLGDFLNRSQAERETAWTAGEDHAAKLLMFLEMQEEFGWEPFRAMFRDYQLAAPEELPRGEEQERDQWLVRFSTIVSRDLTRFFEIWGVPVSAEAKAEVGHLSPWVAGEIKGLGLS